MTPTGMPLHLVFALLAGGLAGYTARALPAPASPPGGVSPPPVAAPPPAERAAEAPPVEAAPPPDAAQLVAARIGLSAWDEDHDNLIDPAEFARGLFVMADLDDDHSLSAAEFEAARAWLPGDPDPETIARWDHDGDGRLDPPAFTAGVIVDQLDSGWDGDGDGRLTRAEISTGLRAAFDRDGDGEIEPSEQLPIARR